MLYGIQRAEQERLAAAREHVRVLIAYGTYWFPWYMRRLAERPANVWFVVRSVFEVGLGASRLRGTRGRARGLAASRLAGVARLRLSSCSRAVANACAAFAPDRP